MMCLTHCPASDAFRLSKSTTFLDIEGLPNYQAFEIHISHRSSAWYLDRYNMVMVLPIVGAIPSHSSLVYAAEFEVRYRYSGVMPQ